MKIQTEKSKRNNWNKKNIKYDRNISSGSLIEYYLFLEGVVPEEFSDYSVVVQDEFSEYQRKYFEKNRISKSM